MLFIKKKEKPIIEKQYFKYCHKRYVIQRCPYDSSNKKLWAISVANDEYYLLGQIIRGQLIEVDYETLRRYGWDIRVGAERLFRLIP